ncbi:MAG: protein kinase domain-containing protein [Syntrophales bacterium]
MAAKLRMTGSSLDGFVLQEKVHWGGMAVIWRVTKTGMALPMVMKMPRIKEGDEPSSIINFEVEQMIMPKLNGVHVPRFVAAGDHDQQPYLVMEHIPGDSLEKICKKAPLPSLEVADIISKVANALHDIHRQHVLHFDVTPGNILFRKSGEAVLIDFGLSRHDQLPDLMAEVYSSLPMGTAPYIAPEQVLHVRNDLRSDIFALGVILYELITGEFPFGSPVGLTGLKRRLYLDPDPPRSINNQCPDWLQEIILKCLEADPARRYGSAAQLALDLQDPAQIVLTARAERHEKANFRTAFGRWLRYSRSGQNTARSVTRHLDKVPIVMAAVDTAPGMEALADTLRRTVQRFFGAGQNARLTCVTVRKTPRVGIDVGHDDAGRNLHMQLLMELKHWARPLEITADKISFHVLEAPDPATALISYAKTNQVEHIIIGARGSSTLRRYLGSVSSHVVAEAPCSVTVVRAPGQSIPVRSDTNGYAGHG